MRGALTEEGEQLRARAGLVDKTLLLADYRSAGRRGSESVTMALSRLGLASYL